MVRELKLGNQKMGQNYEPFIICEISANHNGKIDRALELIRAAAATGGDAIKLQTYTPDTMTIDHESDEFMIKGGRWDGYKLYDLYKEAQTPFEGHEELFQHARNLGVEILSTPFDETAAEFWDELDVPAFKMASFELTDIPLIRHMAKKGKPLIMSTGLASLHEISTAGDAVKLEGNNQIVLLHCVSSYPAPISQSKCENSSTLISYF
jgi:Sialic acid synthase